ncbi:hypothetical protein B0J12DRAFT_578419 [Macrophomina phaseolina]|uniref:C2H2-type domain-containing protein n=1 Tax=Macrophomina phaseolina TaxID=35725 RepID=A0ABQ8G3G6_9PEZI|nr:hypothetical protein B0J12DRAFT_578419 [Macrophomina phaseolina]
MSSTIDEAARACAEEFLRCVTSAKIRGDTNQIPPGIVNNGAQRALNDELGRFKVWAGNLGVFAWGHSSADWRLRHEPDIIEIIVKLLRRLQSNLKSVSKLDDQPNILDDLRSSDLDSSYSSDSSLGISDDVGSEDDAQEHRGEAPRQGRFLSNINETITHLYKITTVIKKPRSAKEYDRIIAWSRKDGAHVEDQLQDLNSHLKWLFGRKYPRLQRLPAVENRIIQSVLLKRKMFLYRASHRTKLARGTHEIFHPVQSTPTLQDTVKPKLKSDKTFEEIPSTGRKGKGKAVTFVGTEASSVNRKGISNYAKSRILPAISPSMKASLDNLDVPSAPRPEQGAMEAFCVYCNSPLACELLERGNATRWKYHVLEDVEPYICLFQDCNTSLQCYKTKGEWIDHMAWQHTITWPCQVLGHDDQLFRSPEDLRHHILACHSSEIPFEQIPFVLEKCAKPAPDVFVALAAHFHNEPTEELSACPFCDESETRIGTVEPEEIVYLPDQSYKFVRDHIASHLESIALLSLPERDDLDATVSHAHALSKGYPAGEDSRSTLSSMSSPHAAESEVDEQAADLEDNIPPDCPSRHDWSFIYNSSCGALNIFPPPEKDETLLEFEKAAREKGEEPDPFTDHS